MKGNLLVAANGQMMDELACVSQEPAEGLVDASPSPAMVRGACPSLSEPMQTGDGLLVRLRPVTTGLTVAQFRALAATAEKHGNGLIEITARGNLQLRGMTSQSMAGLAADVDRAGIVPEIGVAIEVPPLSGVDPAEVADARSLAERLRYAIDSLDPKPLLAAKLAIIIDGGGQLALDGLSADIRLKATKPDDGAGRLWTLAIAGTNATATPLATLPSDEAIAGVVALLKRLSLLGPRARGRDLDPAELRGQFPGVTAHAQTTVKPPTSPIGIISLGINGYALGLRPSFGQIHAKDLARFLAVAEENSVSEIRTGPQHSMLLLGLAADELERVRTVAASCGFQTRDGDPANHIVPCSGAGACASAHYATKQAALDCVAVAPELLDGSFELHLSGCSKGCAHPAPTALAIVGIPTGHAIVLDGSASAEPAVHIGKENLKSVLARLGELVRNNKVAGESARQCLKRLGRDAIATALRQG
ncbi:Precorrin-3B synthase [Rhizobium freirei PRF 81]|uniref:Precorrin-3B synthase n=1 Tax=Rhizobium freirei PRF 81 TaxID=363754 RepID=N6U486_9HYPH|nr:precorrin-3B synthase [Rhizobium freirei]ENN85088.1 Precorrin-3B synthase [Rhizobium freirei PRF 81]